MRHPTSRAERRAAAQKCHRRRTRRLGIARVLEKMLTRHRIEAEQLLLKAGAL